MFTLPASHKFFLWKKKSWADSFCVCVWVFVCGCPLNLEIVRWSFCFDQEQSLLIYPAGTNLWTACAEHETLVLQKILVQVQIYNRWKGVFQMFILWVSRTSRKLNQYFQRMKNRWNPNPNFHKYFFLHKNDLCAMEIQLTPYVPGNRNLWLFEAIGCMDISFMLLIKEHALPRNNLRPNRSSDQTSQHNWLEQFGLIFDLYTVTFLLVLLFFFYSQRILVSVTLVYRNYESSSLETAQQTCKHWIVNKRSSAKATAGAMSPFILQDLAICIWLLGSFASGC